MAKHFIYMADVIDSRNQHSAKLMKQFKELVNEINAEHETSLLSPLTITLGDEFQGVASSFKDLIRIVLKIEERIIQKELNFKLRHVLYFGEIKTPLNKESSHAMLGEGLTSARSALEDLKKSRNNRFFIEIHDKLKSKIFNDILFVLQFLVDDWKKTDYALISEFIEHEDYKKVASVLKKDVSLMWKREKTLRMREYSALKRAILNGSLIFE
jgi:hypothetical protein